MCAIHLNAYLFLNLVFGATYNNLNPVLNVINVKVFTFVPSNKKQKTLLCQSNSSAKMVRSNLFIIVRLILKILRKYMELAAGLMVI